MTGLRWHVLTVVVGLLCMATASTVAAQVPGALPAPGPAASPPGATAVPQADVRALLEVLRDDQARDALLAELERLAAGAAEPGAEGTAEPDVNAAAAPQTVTVGQQLARFTAAAASDLGSRLQAVATGAETTWRRLSVLWGPRASQMLAPLEDVAFILILTVALYAGLRWVAARLYRAAEQNLAGFGVIGRVALAVGSAVLDLLAVILSYAVGHAVALATVEEGRPIDLAKALYLNAFLIVELGKAALGVLLSPKRPAIRIMPMTDAGARYWDTRLGLLVSILGYGMMLVVPVISVHLSFFTGRAVGVVVISATLIALIALVIQHRQAPLIWLQRRSAVQGEDDATRRLFKVLLSAWHWPALLYLGYLLALSIAASGNVGPFMIETLRVGAVLAVGFGAAVAIGAVARRGIRLPETITEPLPMLESRINWFLRSALGVVRFVVFVGTIMAAIQVSSGADVQGTLQFLFGRGVSAVLFSISTIALIAFLIWLAMASWVDFRLNPGRAVAATAREATLLTLLRNAFTVALGVITTMVLLSELGLDIAPLLASAGVLGIAIGFGSQRLVQDIITGVFIQFENAFNVGDVVTVAGTTGAVEKLTIRSVSLRDLNGTFHIIPFSSVDMVSNFMRDFSFHVAEIGIAYREDVQEAKALMFKAFDDLRAMPEFGRVIIGPLDWHGVTKFDDSAVLVRARIRTRPGGQWAVGRAYNELVKRRFDEAGVEIPFPHMTLWFGQNKDGSAPPAFVAREPQVTLDATAEAEDAPALEADGGAGAVPAAVKAP